MKYLSNLILVLLLCGSVVCEAAAPGNDISLDQDKKSFAQSAQALWQRVARGVVTGWKVIRRTSDKLTEKFIGKMSKPLDRSAADRKAAMLDNTLNEANRAAAATIEKTKKANREIHAQKNEGFGSLSKSSSSGSSFTSLSGSSGSSSKGRFKSLD